MSSTWRLAPSAPLTRPAYRRIFDTADFNDKMLDLDKPVVVISKGKKIHQGKVIRTIGIMSKTLAERGDPASIFSGEIRFR